jgi:hypothetical protein
MARHIGCRVAAQLRQFTHVVLALAQKIEDTQARWLGQHLKVAGYLLQNFRGRFFIVE